MSHLILLTLESARHGSIAGSVMQAGFENLIEVFSTDHEVSTDLNPTGRRARGRNKHGAFAVTKGIDKATVLLYDSWDRNDRISVFRLECYNTNLEGVLSLYYSVELEDARISSIQQQLANPALSPVPELEVVSFIYSKITWRFADGNLEASSDTNIGA
ncbi:type VI secretion system tube protein TssD [Algoriphagus marinus]|uniref:type VI secretion system tube protein TssD n=1 Tax=Algoriphagus marinus TaxID=1925762 RepID=UPI00094BA04A|nr:type VI secretion system tube protein TssD [Algoriphagus marinus]